VIPSLLSPCCLSSVSWCRFGHYRHRRMRMHRNRQLCVAFPVMNAPETKLPLCISLLPVILAACLIRPPNFLPGTPALFFVQKPELVSLKRFLLFHPSWRYNPKTTPPEGCFVSLSACLRPPPLPTSPHEYSILPQPPHPPFPPLDLDDHRQTAPTIQLALHPPSLRARLYRVF